jgi:hypothetical protein
VKEVEMQNVQRSHSPAVKSATAMQGKNPAGGGSGVQRKDQAGGKSARRPSGSGSMGANMVHGDIYPPEKNMPTSPADFGSNAFRRRASSAGQADGVDAGGVNTTRRKSIFSGLFGDSTGTGTPSAPTAQAGKPAMLDPELGGSAGLSARAMKGRRQAFIASPPLEAQPHQGGSASSNEPPPPPPPFSSPPPLPEGTSSPSTRAGQPRNRPSLNETPRTPTPKSSNAARPQNRRGSGVGGSEGAKGYFDQL